MEIRERFTYAFLGSLLGAPIGVVCWWLYGLAHSLNYDGPGMDPILQHWLIWSISAFASLGFIFREGIIELLSDTIIAIIHFELNSVPQKNNSDIVAFVFLVITITAIWFTVPR